MKSLSEIETTSKRASRASGYSWGISEEVGKSIVPIDMLRLKLSFFGALKFDPRSDKWLRICMFQGAPLPNELKNYDEQWVYKANN